MDSPPKVVPVVHQGVLRSPIRYHESQDQEARVRKIRTHGFFLGPACKAPEHGRFLLVADTEESTFSVAVEDIEMEVSQRAN